jgi:predicted LPLAT superfamily acyltransferase
MSQTWLKQRERGTVFSMKLIAWIAFHIGRSASRALLYPICLYYMAFAHCGRRASRQYLERTLGRRPRWREVFRHHFWFASVLLDRAFVLADRPVRLKIDYVNRDLLTRIAQSGQGCLLLGAHFGSFDVTRQQARLHGHPEINMLMYEDNAQKLNTVLQSFGARERMKVIPIGAIDSLIRAKERLDRGEWVGILADRVVESERLVRVPFLGGEAAFPAGPFLVASALRVPVVMFVCHYLGGNHYHEHFELFADAITLDRRQREVQLEEWVRRYAARLEAHCRQSPYNWFNFYDFWADGESSGAGAELRSVA